MNQRNMQFSAASVLIIMGVAQGFFLVALLAGKKLDAQANRWMAALVGVVSLHLLEYALDIAGVSLIYPAFIAVTYPLLFLMGPLYHGYVRQLLGYPTTRSFWLHCIPAAVVLLLMMPFYTMDPRSKAEFMKSLSGHGNTHVPAEQMIFMGVHVLQTIVYVLGASILTRRCGHRLRHFTAETELVKRVQWTGRFGTFFLVYLLFYGVGVFWLSASDRYLFEVDYALLVATSAIMYVIGYVAYRHPAISATVAAANDKLSRPRIRGEVKAEKDQLAALKGPLLQLMETGKPYLRQDLKVSDLASAMGIQPYQLSQLINDIFEENFYDFVNRYRVSEAKRLLENGKNPKMLAVAYEVGFNSKATFNRVFKKMAGVTPSAYQARVQQTRSAVSPSAE